MNQGCNGFVTIGVSNPSLGAAGDLDQYHGRLIPPKSAVGFWGIGGNAEHRHADVFDRNAALHGSLEDDSNRRPEVVSESEKQPTTVAARVCGSRGYNCRMKFRVRKRHWIFFVPLFAFNMIGLVLTSGRSQVSIDVRIVLLM